MPGIREKAEQEVECGRQAPVYAGIRPAAPLFLSCIVSLFQENLKRTPHTGYTDDTEDAASHQKEKHGSAYRSHKVVFFRSGEERSEQERNTADDAKQHTCGNAPCPDFSESFLLLADKTIHPIGCIDGIASKFVKRLQPDAVRYKNVNSCGYQKKQQDDAERRGGVFCNRKLPRLCSSREQDERHRADDAQEDSCCRSWHQSLLQLQKCIGFLKRNRKKSVPVIIHNSFCLRQNFSRHITVILEQVIGADAEDLGQEQDLVQIRYRLGAFPL